MVETRGNVYCWQVHKSELSGFIEASLRTVKGASKNSPLGGPRQAFGIRKEAIK